MAVIIVYISITDYYLSPKIVKEAGDALLSLLMFLYNMSLKDGYVFSQWKTVRVNPVFKKDDETEIGNYRPISLLSVPTLVEIQYI